MRRNHYRHLYRRAAAQTARNVSPPGHSVTTDNIIDCWQHYETTIRSRAREVGEYRNQRMYITRPPRVEDNY